METRRQQVIAEIGLLNESIKYDKQLVPEIIQVVEGAIRLEAELTGSPLRNGEWLTKHLLSLLFLHKEQNPAKPHKTDAQIVDECNRLARLFYSQMGYQITDDDDFKFYASSHPQEQGCWNQAAAAYYFIEGTDPDEALANLDEEEE